MNQSVFLSLKHINYWVASGWIWYLGSIRCKTWGGLYWSWVELMCWETVTGFKVCLSHPNFLDHSGRRVLRIYQHKSTKCTSFFKKNTVFKIAIWRVLKHKYVNVSHAHSPQNPPKNRTHTVSIVISACLHKLRQHCPFPICLLMLEYLCNDSCYVPKSKMQKTISHSI